MGKGRQLAGIMLENSLRGRRKHVWISVGNDLALDARRDLDDLGCGNPYSDSDSDDSESESESEFDDEDSDCDNASHVSSNATFDNEEQNRSKSRRKKREASDTASKPEERSGGDGEGAQTGSSTSPGRSGGGGESEGGGTGGGGGGSSSRRSSGGSPVVKDMMDIDSTAVKDSSKGDAEESQDGESKQAKRLRRRHRREQEKLPEGEDGRGVYIKSFQQNKYAYGPIKEGDGVMFLTYSSLVAANRDGKSRLKQVLSPYFSSLLICTLPAPP